MNFYKHHIGDYAQATAHLSFVEDAAYSRMLRKYYAEEKVFPDDIKSIQRLVGARTKEEREAVETVLKEFFTLENDGWHQSRADAEIAVSQDKATRNREIGKRGGRPKKEETQEDYENNPNGFEVETQTVSENNPSVRGTTSHKPIKNKEQNTFVGTAAADPDDSATKSPPPPCPVQEIVAAYNETLPTLPHCREITGSRLKHLQARWRDRWSLGKYATQSDGVGYWRKYFEHVAHCPLLVGERGEWRADFGWLIKPENFVKVIEGSYLPAKQEARA